MDRIYNSSVIYVYLHFPNILRKSWMTGCNDPLSWPDTPLYEEPENDADWITPTSLKAAREAIAGHYAHYDIVAYEDQDSTKFPMGTFIISYGFTDFVLEGDKLVEYDRFCHATTKINQENVKSTFGDDATKAIQPRAKEVEVSLIDGEWKVFRDATPTLLGVKGDASQPLTNDVDDPHIFDADRDGRPGVTVNLNIAGIIKGEIYLIRREIFINHLTLQSKGLYGYVEELL